MVSEVEVLESEAELGLLDPFYFETELLGVGKDDELARTETEMRPYLEWLNEPRDPVKWPPTAKRLRYWSSPRFSAKSIGCAAWCCSEIIKDPNIAIMVMSEEKGQAIKIVGMCRDWLELPKVQRLYGQFKSAKKWAEDEFTVCQRTTTSKKDPTMQASGVTCPMQGWHPDILIWDDLLGETNNTRTGIIQVKTRLAASIPVLRPGGTGVWICTRWDPEDPGDQILKRWRKGEWEAAGPRGFFGCYAVEGDEKFYPHAKVGKPLYPTILPEDEIERHRKEMPFSLFASQILNDPIPTEGAYFRQSDFQHFPLYDDDGNLNPLLKGAIPFMAVDPASGKQQAELGDDHAMVVGYIEWLENVCRMYTVEEAGGRWRTDKFVDVFHTLVEKWRPRKIFVETHTYKDWLMSPLQRRAQEFGFRYPIEEISRGGRNSESKSDRVMSLQTPYVYHQVWHSENIRDGKIEEQLLRFRPNPKDHDDFRDAQAILWQEATKRKYGKKRSGGWKVGNIAGPTIYKRTGV